MKRQKTGSSAIVGCALFFIFIAAVVTAALVIYGALSLRDLSATAVSLAMLGVIFVLSLACTVFDVVRRRITVERHVKQILEAADKIAGGDFSVRLNIPHRYGRYNEYDCIMDNINKMAEELGRTALINSDFISNVSHEIKTPLSIIRNYAALLGGELTGETRRKYAETLISASDRLTSLTVNILKLNKIENSAIAIGKVKVELSDLLATCIIGFEDKIEEKNISLECELSDCSIISSPEYLELVFNNLNYNAV